MRPAIDPANIRRQQTGYKVRRTITRYTLGLAAWSVLFWGLFSLYPNN